MHKALAMSSSNSQGEMGHRQVGGRGRQEEGLLAKSQVQQRAAPVTPSNMNQRYDIMQFKSITDT